MGTNPNLTVPASALIEAHLSELVSPEQCREARASLSDGESLGQALVRLGHLPEARLVEFLCAQYKVQAVDLDASEIPSEVIKLVPREMAERLVVIPIRKQGKRLAVAMADPGDVSAIKDIRFRTDCEIDVFVASDTSIYRAISDHYNETNLKEIWGGREPGDLAVTIGDAGQDLGQNVDVVELEKQSREAPIVKLANLILVRAVQSRASDIHLEPFEKECLVRLRVDGSMKLVGTLKPVQFRWLTSRIKVMSDMNLAESRQPQDGRIRIKFPGDSGQEREVDFRVSTLPTQFGEKVVLRVLDKTAQKLQLDALGFEPDKLVIVRKAIHRPHGIVLVTGPTGSGKTTTLYSALKELNTGAKTIFTVEDPIEIQVERVNQAEVNHTIGFTFAKILRALLRQDPDIIMVGEIRDYETAEIAIQAALVGRLVLSTIHANSAVDTIVRLTSLGVEPSLISRTIKLTLAQRLLRRLCSRCKRVEPTPLAELLALGFTEQEAGQVKTYVAVGCPHCEQTGYSGRIGIYEVMPIGSELRRMIAEHETADQLLREAIRLGMRTLRDEGLKIIQKGQTSVEEVLHVTSSDSDN